MNERCAAARNKRRTRSVSVKKFVAMMVLGAALSWSTAAYAELKLAYVDMQRVVKESNAGKRAFRTLKKRYNRYQKEIRKKENAIKAYQESLKQQAMMLTDDAKRQKAADLQRKVLEFQNFYVEKQKDLQSREQKMMGPIITKIAKLVQTLGSGGEYTMILEKTDARILWAQPALDLTNEVIRRYNAK